MKNISLKAVPWVNDHRVFGSVVYPAAGFIDFARSAVAAICESDLCAVRQLSFLRPLFLSERLDIQLHAAIDTSQRRLEISSRGRDDLPWICHATGWFEPPGPGPNDSRLLDLEDIKRRCRDVSPERLYSAFGAGGIQYGPAFKRVSQLSCGRNEALARIEPADPEESRSYYIFPPVVDAALQVVLGAAMEEGGHCGLPVAITTLTFHARGLGGELYSYARINSAGGNRVQSDVIITDSSGRAKLELLGLTCMQIGSGSHVTAG
jgi:acyl transferase domain-containing protein